MVEEHVVSGSSAKYRTAIGKLRLLSLRCATIGSPHLFYWTARRMAQPFWPMSQKSLLPLSNAATSSSWTTRGSPGCRVREAIEARGAILLYLPPYSPDLNPIEQFFSKLKAFLRKAATRSIESLWAVIRSCLVGFSPRECAAYLANAGYGQPYRKML
jgi:transposase